MEIYIYKTANCLLSVKEGDGADLVTAANSKEFVTLALPYGHPLYALVDNALESKKPQENMEGIVRGILAGSKDKKQAARLTSTIIVL